MILLSIIQAIRKMAGSRFANPLIRCFAGGYLPKKARNASESLEQTAIFTISGVKFLLAVCLISRLKMDMLLLYLCSA